MKTITYEQATTVLTAALAHAREQKFNPLGIAVLDVRGALVAYGAEDGCSLGRAHVAIGKASGVIEMGMGSRALAKRAEAFPVFVGALATVFPRGAIPVAGGVLIKSDGEVVGSIGVSGDTSDNDEAAALAGIMAAGLTGDTGA